VGQATDISERITSLPLSADEIAARRAGEKVRENAETTLGGAIVDRVTPVATPVQTHQAAPGTWD
jgi:hypothetical protein